MQNKDTSPVALTRDNPRARSMILIKCKYSIDFFFIIFLLLITANSGDAWLMGTALPFSFKINEDFIGEYYTLLSFQQIYEVARISKVRFWNIVTPIGPFFNTSRDAFTCNKLRNRRYMINPPDVFYATTSEMRREAGTWTRCLNTDLRRLSAASPEKIVFETRDARAPYTSGSPTGGRRINISLQQRAKWNLRFRITDGRPFSTCVATRNPRPRLYCDPRSRSSGITLSSQAIGVLFAEFMLYACLVCVLGYYKSSIAIDETILYALVAPSPLKTPSIINSFLGFLAYLQRFDYSSFEEDHKALIHFILAELYFTYIIFPLQITPFMSTIGFHGFKKWMPFESF